MGRAFDFLDNTKEEKLIRLSIREKADEVRLRWAKKGIFDVFEILENESILIRMPLKSSFISGFTTFLDENFIVFLNTSNTLGHERFSGAHELGHLTLHREMLLKEQLLRSDENVEREATLFAVEFLMPMAGVEEIFHKIVGVEPKQLRPEHVIRMHQYFKVSYKSMLKRLVYLNLCDISLYAQLAEYCTLENAGLLKELTKKEGYRYDLIEKSSLRYISKEYVEIIRRNYESKKISYKRIESLLDFLGMKPSDFGYEVPDGED